MRGAILLVIALWLAPSAQAAAAGSWAKEVRAPHPLATAHTANAALYAHCGTPDGALARVAAAVVKRRADGSLPPSALTLSELLRATGAPYVAPRAWALAGVHEEGTVAERLRLWAEAHPPLPMRCGVARGADADGKPIVAAVSAPAAAELTPLPSRVRSGQWLSLDARLRVAAQSAKVVLLGPRGRPRRVLASLSGAVVRSRFALDQRGRWLVQVVADIEGGPQPVLEVVMFVDSEPSAEEQTAWPAVAQTAKGLATLLHTARKGEGLASLTRDPILDRVALEHTEKMAELGRTGHDLGDGTPSLRVRRAGRQSEQVGENVASAPTVERIHHALWRSPSHRENMLDQAFQRFGVAVVSRGKRRYATQIFAK